MQTTQLSPQNRLLVGLNGHDPDPHLIRYASMVFRLHRSASLDHEREVRFVHMVGGAPEFVQQEGASSLRSELRSCIATYFRGAGRTNVVCDVLKGKAIRRLPVFADDCDGDLLLVGDAAWPRRACARLAMEAPCPLWLVPSGSAAVLRRVLVPVDFTVRSADSLQAAIDLASGFPRAKCVALHVYPDASRFETGAMDGARRSEMVRAFEDFVAPLKTRGVRVEPLFVASHHVGRAIAETAEDCRVDLVVMATRGRSRYASLIRQSAVESAIRAWSGSLLVLKSPGPPPGVLRMMGEQLRSPDHMQFS